MSRWQAGWLKGALALLCLLALLWMVWQAGPWLLWQNLVTWNWLLGVCLLVWLAGYLLNALSFGCVIKAYSPAGALPFGWMSLLRLTIGGYALNYVTPFGLLGGEPWRISQLRTTLTPHAANSAVAYYAMMHVGSHILFWMIGAGYALWRMECLWREYWLALIGVIAGIVFLLSAVLYLCVRKGWIGRLDKLMREHPRLFWSSLALELLSRVVNVAEYWVLMAAAFPQGGCSDYGSAYLVVALSSLVANMLFFSPLQMGTREGGILLALQWLNMAAPVAELMPVAVSISLATRIREFFWIFIGLLLIIFRGKNHYNLL